MIVLDTHIWVWWVHDDAHLPRAYRQRLQDGEKEGLGISAISCWEVAKLVEKKRLILPLPLDEWFDQALAYPGVHLIPLTPEIAIESTRLPGKFHADPADQIIVATARVLNSPLVSMDARIRAYAYVEKQP